jgi:hypothetical protein
MVYVMLECHWVHCPGGKRDKGQRDYFSFRMTTTLLLVLLLSF